MGYREFRVPAPLAGIVECGWAARTGAGEPAHVQQVLPDGCMDLIWDGGELLVAGPDTAPHPARRAPGDELVGLRFVPGALPGLLGVPASELRDRRVPLAELHPALAAAGTDARTGAQRLLTLALDLPGSGPERGTPALLARIGAGAGAGATADALGWTTRTLHRRCLESFGYGPAVLRRVLRFRRAAALLYAGVAPADVAARAGYADQPHLSREVRALAGVAPGQLGNPRHPSGANRSTPVPSGSSTTA